MSKIKIVLVGGGTGGHFYPLIALADALHTQEQKPDLYYAGPNKYDADALSASNIAFISIPAGKKRKYWSILNYIDVFKTIFGIFVAIIKLYIVYPDVIVSKGGYTSIPVIIGAVFLRIPIIVHESDAKMGTANRFASRFAHSVIIAYEETGVSLHHPRIYNLGIPVRKALLAPPDPDAIQSLNIDPQRPLILVIGGSQGAERVNRLILDTLDELLPVYSIIHQTGQSNFATISRSVDTLIPNEELRKNYHPIAFLNQHELNNAYHLAQIIISRAGSNSIYEIALHGKPSIIIPIPEEISHDQRTNAYAYARSGAAIVLEEKNFSDTLLQSEIDRIMSDTALYEHMSHTARSFGKPDVAEQMSTLILEIAQHN